MDRNKFWDVVAAARRTAGTDDEMFLGQLAEQLRAQPDAELVAFDRVQDDLLDEAYRNELWAAAYIINGGCSDDGFLYFRGWLLSQGRDAYEKAIADPASLVQLLVMDSAWDAELEDFLYLARRVYEERTGREMPFRKKALPDLIGPEWDEESVDDLYPQLSAKANARFSA